MTSILVVGAGIAGPALAHWLRRAGFATTVVERAPGPLPGGHAVDLRGVARTAVARMGLLPAVRDARLRTTSSTTVDAAGQALRTVAADDHGGDGELAEIEILRGELARILRAASDAEFRYDSHLVGLDDDGTGVRATFADGRSERFDVVIGADGLHSRVRTLTFGRGGVRPLGTTIALWTVPDHLGLRDTALDHADGDRFAGVRPTGDGSNAIVYLAFPTPAAEPGDADGQRSLVRSVAAGMGWEVPRFVSALDTAPDLYVVSCAQVVLPAWSRGRIGLLGDAAYCPSPLSGLGTAVALVGAYVLAGELRAAVPDAAAGLRAYEARMRPWVERVQRIPHGEDAGGAGQAAVSTAFALPTFPAEPALTGGAI
jgi:2-polyprenyl-6-methoxyphenol hydroxylase-like FAD-dependent oxidoreductase